MVTFQEKNNKIKILLNDLHQLFYSYLVVATENDSPKTCIIL